MRNVVMAMLLAVASGNATAEWMRVSESAAGTGYADPRTIRKTGDSVTMWEMTNYKIVPDKDNPYQSVKRQYEFDCRHNVMRALSITAYAGRMGSGDAVNTVNDPAKWMPVAAGSAGEILWKIACRR
jgi:hypothetical protein